MAKDLKSKLPYEDFKLTPKRLKNPRSLGVVSDRRYFNFLIKNLTKSKQSIAVKAGPKSYFGGQKSIVKVSYLGNRYPGQWRVHGSYLQREGAQKEQERGLGFNETDEDINISKKLNEWQNSDDPRIWKIIVSPEQADKVNLKDHIKQLMVSIQKDIGTKVEWMAIDHYNTDNFHAHVVIRGININGQELRFDKEYLKKGIRTRSESILTQTLGLRTGLDIVEKRAKTLQLKHVTELDRIIDKDLTADHFINIKPADDSWFNQEKRKQIMGRLQYLETLGLAKKNTSASWQVEPTFIDCLKFIQEQNDVIKSLHKHKDNIVNMDLPLSINKLSNAGDKLIGRFVGTGIIERNEDFRYIFVEGVDGQMHYLTANNSLMKMKDTGQLLQGDILYLERAEIEKDRQKISFIKVDRFDNFEQLKQSKEINNVDRYILDQIKKDGHLPKVLPTDNVVRQEFLKFAEHRVQSLKHQHALKDDLKIDPRNLEKRFKRSF